MTNDKMMSLVLIAMSLVFVEACGSGSGPQEVVAGSAGGAENEDGSGAEVAPVVNIDELDGAWAAAPGNTAGVMPEHCSLITEDFLPADARESFPELPVDPPGRFYCEFEGSVARTFWWAYPDDDSCMHAGFDDPGVKLIRDEISLTHTPRTFDDDDGQPVQEFRTSSVLEDGTTSSWYILLKGSAGTSEYREFLWSQTTSSAPFRSLSDNDGWSRYRQPR